MNIERARFNMVEQQIRPWNVLDPNVLDLLFEVRREEFVPQSYRSLAFADVEIPLTPHAVMMPPRMEARMLQELELVEQGSGPVWACMAWVASYSDTERTSGCSSSARANGAVVSTPSTRRWRSAWRVRARAASRSGPEAISFASSALPAAFMCHST